MKKRDCIIFLTLLFHISMFAQSNDDPKELLQGRWVFKKVTAFNDNAKVKVNLEEIGHELFTEIVFTPEEIILTSNNGEKKMNFASVLRGKFLAFNSYYEWNVIKNKLTLQWIQCSEEEIRGEMKHIDTKITLTYERK